MVYFTTFETKNKAVELDKIYRVPVKSYGGTTVPNSGTVENVYINTKLTVEEVVNIINSIPNESFINFFGSIVYLIICDENEKVISFGFGIYSSELFGYGASIDYAVTPFGALGTSQQIAVSVQF